MTHSVDALLLRHFGLRENPFGVTPDPRFLFMTRTHREALASLVNGIECGFGFQVLVAQPGMGKTTLLFDFLERFQSSRTAFLFQQQHDSREFLHSLLIELKIESEETSNAKLYGQLNHLLSDAAHTQERVIVVVDEAQNLEDPLLETLRQLSNFETARTKLLQIVLAGQPQLAKKLARPEQEQLRQRVSTIARLSPLGLEESRTYLNHRLNIAGYRGPGVFTAAAIQSIWANAQGIPRNMNTLGFNSMLLAYAQNVRRVDEHAVKEAAQDLDLDHILAEVGGQHRPSVGFGNQGPVFRKDPEEQKQDRHLAEVPRPSASNGQQPSFAEPAVSTTSVGVEGRSLNSSTLNAPLLNSPVVVGSPVLNSSVGSSALATSVMTLPELASASSTVSVLTAPSLIVEQKKTSGQQPAVVAGALTQNPAMHPAPQAKRSGTGTGAKVLWTLLGAAALGAAMLVGQGLGTRGQLQVEERSEALAAAPRVQAAPPVLEAPLTQPRNDKKTGFTADDPEVVVRTFPQSTSNQPDGTAPENAVQQNVKAIFFDGDSAVVSSQYNTTLQRIAEILAASPESTAIIEGHTDNSGTERYNLDLSTRRALAIRDVLQDDYNVAATRLSTVGAGSSAPLESNATSSGRAYNRRVEVRIMRPASQP